jgi:hypothetical protein
MNCEKILIERCNKYEQLTKKALKKSKISCPKNSALYFIAKDFLDMSERYLKDGAHYKKLKNYDIALASFSYSHAWLDALARLGLTDVKQDDKLFTLYK